MIGLGEEGFTVEISNDSFILGEFKSVVGYNMFGPWAPPDSKNRSIPAVQVKCCTYLMVAHNLLYKKL